MLLGELMIFDVQGLELVDFFSAFTLVTVEHVSIEIRFPLDSSDLFVVMTDGSLLLCHGAESNSCLHL